MSKRKKELIAFDTLIQSPQLSRMTVANIAKKTGKTKRGVKATLTRRGLKVADYDGRPAEVINNEVFRKLEKLEKERWVDDDIAQEVEDGIFYLLTLGLVTLLGMIMVAAMLFT